MQYGHIRDATDALEYFVECQLATVWEHLDRKSSSKAALRRHMEILDKMLTQLVYARGAATGAPQHLVNRCTATRMEVEARVGS